jgi:hypothetical protein
MNPMHPIRPMTTEPLLARLDRLERRCRRLRGAMLAVLGLGIAVPLLAWRSTDPKVVQAERFELVNADGKLLAEWKIDQSGLPFFELRDANEKPRFRMKIGRGGTEPIFSMHDAEGMQRSSFAIDGPGNPHLVLQDNGQKPRLHMAVSSAGAPSLVFIHADGTMPAGLGIHANGKRWELPAEAGDVKEPPKESGK